MEPPQPAAAAAADPLMRRTVWLACAGPFARLPSIDTQVYYFPRGHADQCRGADLPNLPHDAAVPCTVNSIELRYHPDSDEPYALISLHPGHGQGPVQDPAAPDHEERPALDYYVKHLTGTSDNVCPFAVPKPCAESLFPRLVGASQELHMVDVHGKPLSFKHALSNGSHQLRTNWNDYYRNNKLKMGKGKDAVVFMRCAEGEGGLLIGSRRGEPSSDLALGLVHHVGAEIAAAAAGAEPFTVTYYPRQGWPFVVPRKEVDDALEVNWQQGIKVRMAVPVDDHELQSSRLRARLRAETPAFFQGVITVVNDTRWCKLQVDWAGSSTPNSNVNVWQVEAVEPPSESRNTSDAPSSSATAGSTSDAPSASATAGSIKVFGVVMKPEVKPE